MSEEGYTLTEMLVYVALLSIIIVGIASFLVWIVRAGAQAKIQRETLYGAQRTLDMLTRDVRHAKTASISGSHLILDNATQTEFYLCGDASTTICRDESGTTIELLSEKINAEQLEFVKVNTATGSPSSILINLEISYDNPEGNSWHQASVNLSSAVNLRSY